MHVRKLTLATVLVTALGLAVAACDRGPRLDVRTFQLTHRSGYEAADLIGPYVYDDRAENPGTMSATADAITVRETPDNLEKIGRILEDLDQPIPPIRLHFQLIEADSFQEEDPAISSVVEELRSLFRFEGYRLLGEAMVPVTGGSENGQSFSQQFLGVNPPISLDASARVLRSGAVRLDPVRMYDDWSPLLSTSVNITPGQTLVIGGAQSRTADREGRRAGDRVLILTVRAEVG